MTRKELKVEAKQQLKGNWGTAIGIILIIVVIELCLRFIGEKYFEYTWYSMILSIASLLIMTPLALGKSIYFLKLARKENGQLNDLFSGYKNFLKVIGVSILSEIIILIGFILLIIPGIIFSFIYSQVYYILADNPDIGIIECLKESRKMMKGQKINYFVLMLSFMLWGILTAITLGLAGLYVIPYYEATLVNFYLNIREQRGLVQQ